MFSEILTNTMSKEKQKGEKEKSPNFTDSEDDIIRKILRLIPGNVITVAALQSLWYEGDWNVRSLVNGYGE